MSECRRGKAVIPPISQAKGQSFINSLNTSFALVYIGYYKILRSVSYSDTPLFSYKNYLRRKKNVKGS